MIFDVSGSMADKIDKSRQAVVEFFRTANPQDEFFLITFSEKPEVLVDFTSSIEDIQSKLVYAIPKGRTALLDAIYLGMNRMRKAHYERKALLIISDGGDNHSRYTEGEIKSMVREADVQIYGIGLYRSGLQDAGGAGRARAARAMSRKLLVDGHLSSIRPTSWRMWPRRLASSCATNMCWDTVQPIRHAMANGGRSK